MIKNIIDSIKDMIRKTKYKKAINNIAENQEGTKLFIDLGSSYIKASIGETYISFRASVREALNNELTIQENALNLNGVNYIVSENNLDVGNYTLKSSKENLNVLIAYSILLLSKKVKINYNNIEIFTMLPFNQIGNNKLSKVINGIYDIKDLKGNKIKCNVTTKYIGVEGENSYKYFNTVYGNKCDNTIVLNFGNSTVDCLVMDNTNNSRQEIMTINQGTNLLFPNYLKYLPHVPNSSLLGSFLKSGKFKFSKEEEKQIHKENLLYLKSILFDIESLIKKCNMYSLNIIICGGGSIVLHRALKELIGDRYNIILPSETDCIYSDLKGLKIICNNIDNVIEDIKPNETEEATKETKDNIIDIKDTKKSNFDMFVILRNQGYSINQIYDNNLLPLALSSLKIYDSKYKKILKEQEKELIKNNQLELAI